SGSLLLGFGLAGSGILGGASGNRATENWVKRYARANRTIAPPSATPPASPSMTSTQLIAFIIPTNHSRLIGTSSHIGSSIGSPNGWAMLPTRRPKRTGTAAIQN